MWFSDKEKAAINRIAKAMIFVDENVAAEEIVTSVLFCKKYGIDAEMGDIIDPDEALNVIAALSSEEKEMVCAYLGTLMAIDGEVDSRELLYWNLLSFRCGFPEMNVPQAVMYFNSHI